jgi:dipeptidyl aminopeptidase/acylaminoacyl peptidase
MPRQDLLARLRLVDPNLRFDEGDDFTEASVVLRQVLSRPRPGWRRYRRLLSVPRLAAIAAAVVAVVLLLPALAVGTSPFRLLATEPEETLPVNGLLVARAADSLYLIDPASGGLLRLRGTDDMDHPAWSPDGRLLAVERTENGSTSVYAIWPNGSHPQLILKNASAPVWASDGTRVFVQRDTCSAPGACDASADDPTVIYSVAPDGTDAHQISDEDAFDVSQAGWPSQTTWLSFLADEGSGATAHPTTLDSSAATFSPDETTLAFADPDTGIWVVKDGTKPELLTKGTYSTLSWGTAVEKRPSSVSGR